MGECNKISIDGLDYKEELNLKTERINIKSFTGMDESVLPGSSVAIVYDGEIHIISKTSHYKWNGKRSIKLNSAKDFFEYGNLLYMIMKLI